MKKYKSIILCCLIFTCVSSKKTLGVAEASPSYFNNSFIFFGNPSGIRSIKIYLIEWQKKRRFAIGIKQIKEYHEHYFVTDGIAFNKMFDDYKDCISKLSSGKSLSQEERFAINSLVVLKFNNHKKVEIYFDVNGNYCFNMQWFRVNYDLYYLLFNYFSNVIIPEQTLTKANENFNGGFWDEKK